jgi:putative endonuclease
VSSLAYFVYLLASQRNGTLYTGVTGGLGKRVFEHRTDQVDGFTKTYGVHRLVWFEAHDFIEAAIAREKSIKRWRRAWKLELIEKDNPQWRDLFDDLTA